MAQAKHRGIVFCAAVVLAVHQAGAQPAHLTESQKIEALLKHIGGLQGATFIRNGTPATAAAAASHLRMKWKAAGDGIGSALEFIEKIASRSSMSGKEYLIRLADGTESPSGDYLKRQLQVIESGTPATAPTAPATPTTQP